jgi:hypothetical protein
VTSPQQFSVPGPVRPRRSAPEPEPAVAVPAGEEDVAPVDRQADPAHWLPPRALLVVAAVAVLALIATVVVCLTIWTTTPIPPLRIPTVRQG